jgi:predicted GIY-YIG superfamily endonuclease
VAVYLLHFEEPVYGTSRHYIGFTNNLEQRIKQHRYGHAARLTSLARKRGISWEVARVWEDGDKVFERQLKKKSSANKLCPICTPPKP